MPAAPRRLGYACLCRDLPDASPRGTILRNATPDRLRALIVANLDGLAAVLRFNVEHGITMFRISSDVIPFGSHPANTLAWWDENADALDRLGRYIRAHDLRVSVHPGQYTVLAAPRPEVVEAAVRDLVFHARLLDALGTDSRHKIVIHVGGAYGDPAAALDRWVAAVRTLPDRVRARLVLENDERLYGVEDVLRAARAADVPVVFDVLHHRVHRNAGRVPSAAVTPGFGPLGDDLPDVLAAVFDTWHPARDGVPKLHYSTQALNQRPGAHAEYVDPEEFADFLDRVPDGAVYDVMLEAKAKEQALFRLREAPVLRPFFTRSDVGPAACAAPP